MEILAGNNNGIRNEAATLQISALWTDIDESFGNVREMGLPGAGCAVKIRQRRWQSSTDNAMTNNGSGAEILNRQWK
jgi:hypothetical protein